VVVPANKKRISKFLASLFFPGQKEQNRLYQVAT